MPGCWGPGSPCLPQPMGFSPGSPEAFGTLGLSERREEPFSLPELVSPSGVRVGVRLGQCGSRRGWGQLCGQEAGRSELRQRVVNRKEQGPGLPWGWTGSRQAGALLFASVLIGPKPQRTRDLLGHPPSSGADTGLRALLDSPTRCSETQNLGWSPQGWLGWARAWPHPEPY